jgi:hypothetical protein
MFTCRTVKRNVLVENRRQKGFHGTPFEYH